MVAKPTSPPSSQASAQIFVTRQPSEVKNGYRRKQDAYSAAYKGKLIFTFHFLAADLATFGPRRPVQRKATFVNTKGGRCIQEGNK